MKHIYYFNINYSCNSRCLFCYSHNTRHDSSRHGEISPERLADFLAANGYCSGDRVIVNGGEPLLHSRITEILHELGELRADVLVYTNGRLLHTLDLAGLNERFRFIVPFHGGRRVHDSITGIPGSWEETANNMELFRETACLLDMKIILNARMIADFAGALAELQRVYFSNALHITSMAETPESRRHNFPTMTLTDSAKFTAETFRAFTGRAHTIKLYDTCTAGLRELVSATPQEIHDMPEVFYCDVHGDRRVFLHKPHKDCAAKCNAVELCISEVSQMKVLEYSGGNFYEGMD